MEKNRLLDIAGYAPKRADIINIFFIFIIFLMPSCSIIPKIVILKDPLSAEEHVTLGKIYYNKGEKEFAVSEFEQALKKEKNNLDALVFLGDYYFQNKEYKLSEKYLLKAYKYYPEHPLILNNLAWLYITINQKHEKAELYLKKALSIDSARKYIYLDSLLTLYYKIKIFEPIFKDSAKQNDAYNTLIELENTLPNIPDELTRQNAEKTIKLIREIK